MKDLIFEGILASLTLSATLFYLLQNDQPISVEPRLPRRSNQTQKAPVPLKESKEDLSKQRKTEFLAFRRILWENHNVPVEKKPKLSDQVEFKDLICWNDLKLEKKTSENLLPILNDVNKKLFLYQGDLTLLRVQAIVNSANFLLEEYGPPMDRIIRQKSGPLLSQECNAIIEIEGPLSIGQAEITLGYGLPCQFVIHGVGPVDSSLETLKKTYLSVLFVCEKHSISTVAFCLVFTQNVSLSKHLEVGFQTIRSYLEQTPHSSVKAVVICPFVQKDRQIVETLMLKYFPKN